MIRTVFNVTPPKGISVIRSASGSVTHVSKPLGSDLTRKIVSVGAMKRASDARKAANVGD